MYTAKVSRKWPGSKKGARSGMHTNERMWMQENGELVQGNKRKCTAVHCSSNESFITIDELIQHYRHEPNHPPPPLEDESLADIKESIQRWLRQEYNYLISIEEVERIISNQKHNRGSKKATSSSSSDGNNVSIHKGRMETLY